MEENGIIAKRVGAPSFIKKPVLINKNNDPQKQIPFGFYGSLFSLNFYSHHEHGIPKGKDTIFFFHRQFI